MPTTKTSSKKIPQKATSFANLETSTEFKTACKKIYLIVRKNYKSKSSEVNHAN